MMFIFSCQPNVQLALGIRTLIGLSIHVYYFCFVSISGFHCCPNIAAAQAYKVQTTDKRTDVSWDIFIT